jgi:hypothetical protein
MNRARKSIPVIAMLVLGFLPMHAFGKGRNLKGIIVAYDPTYHGLKQASFVKNLEVTIADLGENPHRLVKVVFEGFGQQQISQDVLDGEKPFHARAVRDKSCDEAHPRVLSQSDSQLFQGSGAFLLNQAHRAVPLGSVENLACYRVEVAAAGR